MARLGILVAALLGASGVAVGAFHAHGLQEWLAKANVDPTEVTERLDRCGTAVRYQMYHALALLAVSILALRMRHRGGLMAGGVLLLSGTAGFSGGLYLNVFTGNFFHPLIVPAGGMLLILGWIVTGAAALFSRETELSTSPDARGPK